MAIANIHNIIRMHGSWRCLMRDIWKKAHFAYWNNNTVNCFELWMGLDLRPAQGWCVCNGCIVTCKLILISTKISEKIPKMRNYKMSSFNSILLMHGCMHLSWYVLGYLNYASRLVQGWSKNYAITTFDIRSCIKMIIFIP
jgi:hypothetical protein